MPPTTRLAANQFYTSAATPAFIVEVLGNVAMGEERLDVDALFRHTVHRTLDGVQVEFRQNPPVLVPGDRQVTIHVPVIGTADLTLLRAIRLGGYGFPVLWSSKVIPLASALQVVIFEVNTKAHAGAVLYSADILLQPL